MNKPRGSGMRRVRESSTATTLELFFDLVFVFALTQVTALMADDVTWNNLLRGALLLAVVWWCWIAYSWLSNVVRADEGMARTAMLAAMAAMFLIALAIPEAFDDLPGGLSGPMVFAFCYLLVRLVHLVLYWIVAKGDAGLRNQLIRFFPTLLGGTALLLVASQTTGATQTALWAGAVVADYGGTLIIGAGGWRLNSARHFAERYGLIVIIALGESIVAIGVGVNHLPISWPIVVAALLGLTLAAALWWAYFDTHAFVTERALAETSGVERAKMARAAFTYLHLPLIIGIVMLALGLKKVLNYVGGADGHVLSDPLYGPGLWALTGGTALYLFAHVGISWRCGRMVKLQRFFLGVSLLAITPVLALVPALAALAVLTMSVVILIMFEWVWYRDLREEIRHASEEHDGEPTART
ncbi:MAG: low temperature requirement protein A [Actinomycetota bacterium]|nr:low temperature requirement protein A [Actinomycetota bacterium]